jgi:hypothetical protein
LILFILFVIFSTETRKKGNRKATPGRIVTQLEARVHLEMLFEKEQTILDLLFGEKQQGEGCASPPLLSFLLLTFIFFTTLLTFLLLTFHF